MISKYKKIICVTPFLASVFFGGVTAGTFVYPEVLNLALKNQADRYFKNVFGENYEYSNQKTILFVRKYLKRRIMFANSTDLAEQEIFRAKGSVTVRTNMLVLDEQVYVNSKDFSNDFLPYPTIFRAKTDLCFLWMVNENLGLDLSYMAFDVKKTDDVLYKFLAHPEKPMLMDNEKRRLWEVNFEKSVEKNYTDLTFLKKVLPTSKKCAEQILFVLKNSYQE